MFGWLLALVVVIAVLIVWQQQRRLPSRIQDRHVCVLVLGDVGRSPRMSYHALSLANHGFRVTLVGYRGAQPMQSILNQPNIRLCYIPEPIQWRASKSRLMFVLTAPVKVLVQLASLVGVCIVQVRWASYLLVQNPPSIPTLALAQGLAFLWGCRLIIDWHNFGYSILSLRFSGEQHWLVKIAQAYEHSFGRQAFAHFSVTKAMSDVLADHWRLSSRPVVLHDKAPTHFKHLDLSEIHKFLLQTQSSLSLGTPSPQETLLTVADSPSSKISVNPRRPALLVSSTSWTQDEDFGLLFDALQEYAKAAASPSFSHLAPLVVIVTGRGPLKEYYEAKFAQLETSQVRIRTAWLKAEDYPRLLGCADLGISLHTSSSGLDLPMKVVDMFGCGLPVCAVRFQCIHELVCDGVNGLVFASSKELSQQLIRLFSHWNPQSNHVNELMELAAGAALFQQERWEDHWTTHALPLFAS